MGYLLLFNETEFLSQPENKCFMIFTILLVLPFGWILFKNQAHKVRAVKNY